MENEERKFEIFKAAVTGMCANRNFTTESLSEIVGFASNLADIAELQLAKKDVEKEGS